jgi:hypothetical protein
MKRHLFVTPVPLAGTAPFVIDPQGFVACAT